MVVINKILREIGISKISQKKETLSKPVQSSLETGTAPFLCVDNKKQMEQRYVNPGNDNRGRFNLSHTQL